jgi:hypothetical protein
VPLLEPPRGSPPRACSSRDSSWASQATEVDDRGERFKHLVARDLGVMTLSYVDLDLLEQQSVELRAVVNF